MPHGSELIAKPASAPHPPVDDGGDVEMIDVESTDTPVGASSRGLFLRIDSIYAEQRETSPGGKPTAMLSGMLYELVDEDWEEVNDTEEPQQPGPSRQALSSFPNDTLKSSAPVSQTPLFIPNPALLSSAPLTASSDSSDDMLNLKGEDNGLTQDKGKGKATADPPVIRSSRRVTFKPSPDGVGAPPDTTVPLSAPSPPYPHRLPAPPPKYKFRPILPKTHEATMSVVLLSGRYIPGILKNPLLEPFIDAAGEASSGAEPERPMDRALLPLLALEGLVAGVHNAVDPSAWMSNRVGMVRAASETAQSVLLRFWKSREEPDPDIIIVD